MGVWREVGWVFGGWGRCRRRNLLEVGVRKAEMWDEAKWSIRLRYLRRSQCLHYFNILDVDSREGWAVRLF